MNIFFDVDDTLITWDVKLRPNVHHVFQQLRDDGHTIYLWSGYGPRWEVVRRFDLHEHIAKEEDGLFPASLTELDGEDWDTAIDAWHRAHPGQPMIEVHPQVDLGNPPGG